MSERRRAISQCARINAPATVVWQTIAAPGNLVACHPFCKDNPVIRWSGATSVDEVHYLNGIVYERRFRDWHENRGYDLEIFHKDRALARVSWRITPDDHELSTLTITVDPAGLQQRSPLVRWFAHYFVIRPKMRSYLSSVLRGFKWYIEKGEAVPRNKFGEHPWFSA